MESVTLPSLTFAAHIWKLIILACFCVCVCVCVCVYALAVFVSVSVSFPVCTPAPFLPSTLQSALCPQPPVSYPDFPIDLPRFFLGKHTIQL